MEEDFIEVKMMGLPAKQYYKINKEAFEKFTKALPIGQEVEKPIGQGVRKSRRIISNIEDESNIEDKKTSSKEEVNDSAEAESITPDSSNPSPDKDASLQDRKGNPVTRERPTLSQTSEYMSKEEKIIIAPKELIAWNGLGVRKHMDATTKVFKETVSAIRKLKQGTYFDRLEQVEAYYKRKFTEEEIIGTMRNFSLAATSLDYEPANKKYLKGLSLIDFLYNPRSNGEQSQFIKYLENPPELCKDNVREKKDDHPQVTATLMRSYIEGDFGEKNYEFTQG